MFRFGRRALSALTATLMIALVVSPVLAATTVVVRPTSLNGWIVDTTVLGNPPVPTTFEGPADSDGGAGSLQFGPIDAAPPQAKFEAQPPEVNMLASDFGGLSYEFQVLAPAAVGVSAKHFYANVYVDSSANGIGTFTSWYDCRFSYVPQSSIAGWNLFSVDASTAATSVFPAGCPSTLDALPAGSRIMFFRLNGGDTSANDNGLTGAYDLVSLTFGGETTIYDFEPALAQPASKDDCKKGGHVNLGRADGSTFNNQGTCIQYFNTGK